MEINTVVYHPCSMDILEYKITGVRVYSDHNVYEATATHNIGACDRVKVLLTSDKKGAIRFTGFHEDWEHEYSSGLEDFVEGFYYEDRQEARSKYYETQRTLCWSSMEEKRRLYEQAKQNYDRVENILKQIVDDVDTV